jgi:hypothetical protein
VNLIVAVCYMLSFFFFSFPTGRRSQCKANEINRAGSEPKSMLVFILSRSALVSGLNDTTILACSQAPSRGAVMSAKGEPCSTSIANQRCLEWLTGSFSAL